jgi:hypothetical protein
MIKTKTEETMRPRPNERWKFMTSPRRKPDKPIHTILRGLREIKSDFKSIYTKDK